MERGRGIDTHHLEFFCKDGLSSIFNKYTLVKSLHDRYRHHIWGVDAVYVLCSTRMSCGHHSPKALWGPGRSVEPSLFPGGV